jgi:hypothetical protein
MGEIQLGSSFKEKREKLNAAYQWLEQLFKEYKEANKEKM